VGVVSVPLKLHPRNPTTFKEVGRTRDVKSQAQVSRKVEGRTVKERERRDERETVNWIDREEG
jgi:hypothetical protein